MNAANLPPELFVEGADDISVVSALLARHGVDTDRGRKILCIKSLKTVDKVLENMPEAIRKSTDRPVGFVLDIDIDIATRWQQVCAKIREVGVTPPSSCPGNGFFGQCPDYPHKFAVWLMPDCATDDSKTEHLISSLMRKDDPLWPLACDSVSHAVQIIDEVNAENRNGPRYGFRSVDRIKAEVHTWLAWQREPGARLGAAINDHILEHDSPQALAFLRWLKTLYNLHQLDNI